MYQTKLNYQITNAIRWIHLYHFHLFYLIIYFNLPGCKKLCLSCRRNVFKWLSMFRDEQSGQLFWVTFLQQASSFLFCNIEMVKNHSVGRKLITRLTILKTCSTVYYYMKSHKTKAIYISWRILISIEYIDIQSNVSYLFLLIISEAFKYISIN